MGNEDDILAQLWRNAQQGFVSAYDQPTSRAYLPKLTDYASPMQSLMGKKTDSTSPLAGASSGTTNVMGSGDLVAPKMNVPAAMGINI